MQQVEIVPRPQAEAQGVAHLVQDEGFQFVVRHRTQVVPVELDAGRDRKCGRKAPDEPARLPERAAETVDFNDFHVDHQVVHDLGGGDSGIEPLQQTASVL